MHNVGSLDRIVRVVIGVALLALWFVLEGNLRYLALVGFVPLLTAALSFCPAYRLVGINTAGEKPPTDAVGKTA